jgi:hypothetical protein
VRRIDQQQHLPNPRQKLPDCDHGRPVPRPTNGTTRRRNDRSLARLRAEVVSPEYMISAQVTPARDVFNCCNGTHRATIHKPGRHSPRAPTSVAPGGPLGGLLEWRRNRGTRPG